MTFRVVSVFHRVVNRRIYDDETAELDALFRGGRDLASANFFWITAALGYGALIPVGFVAGLVLAGFDGSLDGSAHAIVAAASAVTFTFGWAGVGHALVWRRLTGDGKARYAPSRAGALRDLLLLALVVVLSAALSVTT